MRWLKAQSAESTHSWTCPASTDAAWSQHLFLTVMTLHCRSDKHKHKLMYLQSDHLSLSAASLQPSSWPDGGHSTNQLLLLLLWFGKLSAPNDLKALRRQSVILSLTLPYLLSFTVWFFSSWDKLDCWCKVMDVGRTVTSPNADLNLWFDPWSSASRCNAATTYSLLRTSNSK